MTCWPKFTPGSCPKLEANLLTVERPKGLFSFDDDDTFLPVHPALSDGAATEGSATISPPARLNELTATMPVTILLNALTATPSSSDSTCPR